MENKDFLEKLEESSAFIKEKVGSNIDLALILGSGLGELADSLENAIVIPYSDIPHFPNSTAPGHFGRLVVGNLGGQKVLCMQGRFHFYEGYDMATVGYPIFVFGNLGIKKLILTNACGCLRKDWNVGDLMIIKDHIKLSVENPLRGRNYEELGERFFDMSNTYTPSLIELAKNCAKEMDFPIRTGVYQYFSGPSFETGAEVKMARILGSDAVGMSTVPEAIVASYLKMELLGICCLTNMATGITDQPLNQDEVIEAGKKVKPKFIELLNKIVTNWK